MHPIPGFRWFPILVLPILFARPARAQGPFEDYPSWYSDTISSTRAAAFGDVDGDGDLDVVCVGERVSCFRNDVGTLTSEPVWSSSEDLRPKFHGEFSLALGDTDGDGDLDIFCGLDYWGTLLFRNDEGVFTSGPVWTSSTANRTTSVDVADMDGDGDLDLVCGSFMQRSTMYLNEGGLLNPEPAWLSGQPDSTSAIVLGMWTGTGIRI